VTNPARLAKAASDAAVKYVDAAFDAASQGDSVGAAANILAAGHAIEGGIAIADLPLILATISLLKNREHTIQRMAGISTRPLRLKRRIRSWPQEKVR
jgi:hypothetical protein